VIFLGVGQSKMALIFSRRTCTPCSLMICPKYYSSIIPNSHLDSLAYNDCACIMPKTSSKCAKCSTHVLLYNKMLSKNTERYFHNYPLNMWFMQDWNVVDALVNPNCMTKKSKCPKWHRKFVFSMSCSLILIWWYHDRRSILVKKTAPCSSSINSSMCGMQYLFLIVFLLRAL